MGKAQIEASVPGGIWGDNATFEARGSVDLMQSKTQELLGFLKSQGAVAADH